MPSADISTIVQFKCDQMIIGWENNSANSRELCPTQNGNSLNSLPFLSFNYVCVYHVAFKTDDNVDCVYFVKMIRIYFQNCKLLNERNSLQIGKVLWGSAPRFFTMWKISWWKLTELYALGKSSSLRIMHVIDSKTYEPGARITWAMLSAVLLRTCLVALVACYVITVMSSCRQWSDLTRRHVDRITKLNAASHRIPERAERIAYGDARWQSSRVDCSAWLNCKLSRYIIRVHLSLWIHKSS